MFVWSWWSRSHRRSDAPSGSPAYPPVRTGSSGCSLPGTRTRSVRRCRSTPRLGWADCSVAEPWEWAKLGASSRGCRGARAALWCPYCSVPRHGAQPWFLRLKAHTQLHDNLANDRGVTICKQREDIFLRRGGWHQGVAAHIRQLLPPAPEIKTRIWQPKATRTFAASRLIVSSQDKLVILVYSNVNQGKDNSSGL